MVTAQEFEMAYLRLAQRMGIELQPQNTYGRMLLEWKAQGCPEDIEQFLQERLVTSSSGEHPLLV